MKKALLFLMILGTPSALAVEIVGTATVTDGDTLKIRGVKIRLWGIDAPESSQICTRRGSKYGCGRSAAFYLDSLTKNKTVRCVKKDVDRYGRIVAVCYVGKAELNRAMVLAGWALPYIQYGGGVYNDSETKAMTGKKGMYEGTFQKPWDYRNRPRTPPTAGTAKPAPTPTPATGEVYYRNCTAARAAGAAPIYRGEPGYRSRLDRDNDGVACE